MVCNIGILGPGFVATRAILPALQRIPQARVLAVASRDSERFHLVSKQFGIERAYNDYPRPCLVVPADSPKFTPLCDRCCVCPRSNQ